MLLVTGGAGYVGSHFIKAFLDRNPEEKVVVIDNLSIGHRDTLDFSDRIHLVECDVGDRQRVETTMGKFAVSAVAHFAQSAYVGESESNPLKYFRNNCVQSMALFEAMEACRVKKIVFSSSCAVYGPLERPTMDEEHPLNPSSVYGLTKLICEKTLASLAERLAWSVVALRYFNVAGADEEGLIGERHDPEPHIIPRALMAACGSLPELEIFGDDYDTPDGTCLRDYVHVCDLADAHCLALERLSSATGFDVFNLGTTGGASVKEVVAACEHVTGKPVPCRITARRPGDAAVLIADCRKAKEKLGWMPRRGLDEMIASAWRWQTSFNG